MAPKLVVKCLVVRSVALCKLDHTWPQLEREEGSIEIRGRFERGIFRDRSVHAPMRAFERSHTHAPCALQQFGWCVHVLFLLLPSSRYNTLTFVRSASVHIPTLERARSNACTHVYPGHGKKREPTGVRVLAGWHARAT